MHAAVVIAQVAVHRFALEHGHGAGRLAESHGIDGDQAAQVGEPVHEREAHRSGIETVHVRVGVVLLEMLQGVNADTIVLQEVVADPDDRDRMHAEEPRKTVY